DRELGIRVALENFIDPRDAGEKSADRSGRNPGRRRVDLLEEPGIVEAPPIAVLSSGEVDRQVAPDVDELGGRSPPLGRTRLGSGGLGAIGRRFAGRLGAGW